MHPRISVSAISTFGWTLEQDLAFWAAHRIDNVGISVAKLERSGWDEATTRILDAGLRVTNLIGLGPFRLAEPAGWPAQQERLLRAVEVADRLGAECMVCTTGPAGPLPWDEAADAFADAMRPALDEARTRQVPLALEHTNPLRVDVGFVHTLRDAVDLGRRLGIGVCLEANACWAERDLEATIRDGIEEIRLVQLSDYRVGTLTTPARLVPGDGDIPLERLVRTRVVAGYRGTFDLELIGPAIDAEGYDTAVPRAVTATTSLLARIGL